MEAKAKNGTIRPLKARHFFTFKGYIKPAIVFLRKYLLRITW